MSLLKAAYVPWHIFGGTSYFYIIWFMFLPTVGPLFIQAWLDKNRNVLFVLFKPFIKNFITRSSSWTCKGKHSHISGKYTEWVLTGIFKAFLIDFLHDILNLSIHLLDKSHNCDHVWCMMSLSSDKSLVRMCPKCLTNCTSIVKFNIVHIALGYLNFSSERM